MLINEEFGIGFPLVSFGEFQLISFNGIDIFIGPKCCQWILIWIENRINKVSRCHLNKMERHHKRSKIERNLLI
jgi:hypothetical protein